MPNIHTPERGVDETQKQYKLRRARSKAAVKLATKGPKQSPANLLDQPPNPKRRTQSKEKAT